MSSTALVCIQSTIGCIKDQVDELEKGLLIQNGVADMAKLSAVQSFLKTVFENISLISDYESHLKQELGLTENYMTMGDVTKATQSGAGGISRDGIFRKGSKGSAPGAPSGSSGAASQEQEQETYMSMGATGSTCAAPKTPPPKSCGLDNTDNIHYHNNYPSNQGRHDPVDDDYQEDIANILVPEYFNLKRASSQIRTNDKGNSTYVNFNQLTLSRSVSKKLEPPSRFTVEVQPTKCAEKLQLVGVYHLEVSPHDLALKCPTTGTTKCWTHKEITPWKRSQDTRTLHLLTSCLKVMEDNVLILKPLEKDHLNAVCNLIDHYIFSHQRRAQILKCEVNLLEHSVEGDYTLIKFNEDMNFSSDIWGPLYYLMIRLGGGSNGIIPHVKTFEVIKKVDGSTYIFPEKCFPSSAELIKYYRKNAVFYLGAKPICLKVGKRK